MTDEHGEYRVLYRFVDRWTTTNDTGMIVPGWCICEVRSYDSRTIAGKLTEFLRIHRYDPTYDNSDYDGAALADIYQTATSALIARDSQCHTSL